MFSSTRLFRAALLLIVVVGAGLRLSNLSDKSLWADELFTVAVAKYHPMLPEQGIPFFQRKQVLEIADGDSFLTAKAAEQSPPLNDFLEKITVNWLSNTELAARLPAALAACSLLAWFAWFAWHSTAGHERRTLAWSLLILALYPALITYAKDGRAYSIGVSLVGMGGLLWMMRWRSGWRYWSPPGWAEIGLFTLACYSHYNAAMLVTLLLCADAVMAVKRRSTQTGVRLCTLGGFLSLWLALNAHAILFTAGGGVAWGQASAMEYLLATAGQAYFVMHPYWLWLAAAVAISLILMRWRQHQAVNATLPTRTFLVLGLLTITYIVFAGVIAAKAGMGHPRYYIFILPIITVMMGMVFSELRQPWQVVGTALLIVLLSVSAIRLAPTFNNQDFRSMASYSASTSNGNSIFLYPWKPNRDLYRLYLDQYLVMDGRDRMVGVSSPKDSVDVCNQIRAHSNIVVMGHDSGKSIIDAVYQSCGNQWPKRTRKQFHNTFAEHWESP